MTTTTKIISSLEKVFPDQNLNDFDRLDRVSVLKGERVSFQLACYIDGQPSDGGMRTLIKPDVKGDLADYVTLRRVTNVPIECPVWANNYDEQFLRTTPGLYPDRLDPMVYDGKFIGKANMPACVWVDVTVPRDTDKVGESELVFDMTDNFGNNFTEKIVIDVINAELPEDDIYFTQWFHCDSIANYYRVPVWSEEHWRLVENFARVAVKNGINLLLTPVFTPPLDTAVGGERLTTQLVGVTKTADKSYTFDFSLVDRWVQMCDRVGVKYFEISHLFTQWGAQHAPKIMATVDGEYKQIFGWDTEAAGEEYTAFLQCFLTAFLSHMKASGNDKRCFFHISDEPQIQHLEYYKAAKKIVSDILKDYVIMDALSDYDFWEKGIVSTPIPVNTHMKRFIENNVPNLWTYYCCGQSIGVSNRLVAMPSWRNRSIGMQMYKYDIVGFLHWGYNFYNNQLSVDQIDPATDLSGGHWVPAGDAHSVYPGLNGEAIESLRIVVFHDALQDMKAMKLCGKYYPKEQIVAEMEKILGAEIVFERCAYSAKEMLAIREKINEMIKAKI